LEVVRAARFAQAFTFQYSTRPGTPAAEMGDQVPKAVVQERYDRLVALVNDITWAENRALVGRDVELLVTEADGRKDNVRGRRSGRGPDNRLVHFAPGTIGESAPGSAAVAPGEFATVTITQAAPHHLVSDAPVRAVRRRRSADGAGGVGSGAGGVGSGAGAAGSGSGVMLGLPTVGAPAPAPVGAGPACGCD
jgi:tRNA-2-methylthio-N6-dimethylallyladenosine synthase